MSICLSAHLITPSLDLVWSDCCFAFVCSIWDREVDDIIHQSTLPSNGLRSLTSGVMLVQRDVCVFDYTVWAHWIAIVITPTAGTPECAQVSCIHLTPPLNICRYAEKFILKRCWQDEVIIKCNLLATPLCLFCAGRWLGRHVPSVQAFFSWQWSNNSPLWCERSKTAPEFQTDNPNTQRLDQVCICLCCNYTVDDTCLNISVCPDAGFYSTVWLSCMSRVCHLFRLQNRSVLTRFS